MDVNIIRDMSKERAELVRRRDEYIERVGLKGVSYGDRVQSSNTSSGMEQIEHVADLNREINVLDFWIKKNKKDFRKMIRKCTDDEEAVKYGIEYYVKCKNIRDISALGRSASKKQKERERGWIKRKLKKVEKGLESVQYTVI